MSVFVGQTNLTISLITGNELTNVDESYIKFKRPDTTEGQWTASVNGQLLEYNVQSGDLNQSGSWYLWSYILFNNGKISIGEPVLFTVKAEGSL